MYTKEKIRNIAIIAHVDHGKTTLVDAMLRQSGTFRTNERIVERVMDSNDLERERGITILAKNTSLFYKDIKINIVDTPGHADFGGEVERSLKSVDGVLLLIDAFEGCMPQTRFVLKKALSLNLKVIIVVNKIDRKNARSHEVVDEALELLLDLGATEEQLDSPIIYASGRNGSSTMELGQEGTDLTPLFELIKDYIPCPSGDENRPFQMMVSNIGFDEYTGRLAIGKIERGKVKVNSMVSICRQNGEISKGKLTKIYIYNGLKTESVEEAAVGEIIAVSGVTDINIGETICASDAPEALPFVDIDEPVLSMTFSVNDSPFAGKEGQYVTSRHLRDRLFRELKSNVSLKVEEIGNHDSWVVFGRGELHLSVLIENMRREGYEFQVSKPQVINKLIDGQLQEPIEYLTIDVPDEYTGVVMEAIGARKGELKNMAPISQGYTRIEFKVPTRGLIGYRNQLMTDTKGHAIMNHIFDSFELFKGEIPGRLRGSLIAFETGKSVAYGLFNAQERGNLFIGAGVPVYAGMIVGQNAKADDMTVNVCKRKQMTNMRASGSDEALKLITPRNLSLEQCLDFIADDELLEVTPHNLRLRKRVLDAGLRAKANKS